MTTAVARFVLTADDRTKAAFKNVEAKLNRLSNTATKVASSLGITLGVGAFGAIVRSSIQAGDEINRLSIRLGASTEALSQYRLVADRAGISFETFTMGLQRMTRRVSEAAQGTGEAKGALQELGLDVQKLKELKPEDQFEAIAEAMQGVENQSDRVRLAMRLFDSEGVSLLQTMEGGAASIKRVREEADRMGLTLSTDQAKAMSDAREAMANLSNAFLGVGNTLAVEVGPTIVEFLNTISSGLPKAVDFASKSMIEFQAFFVGAKLKMLEFLDAIPGANVRKELRETMNAMNELRLSYAGIILEEKKFGEFSPAKGQMLKSVQVQTSQLANLSLSGQAAENAAQKVRAETIRAQEDQLRQQIQGRFEQLQESMMSEEEQLALSYARRAEIVQNALGQQLITEERANALLVTMQANLMNDIAKVRQKGLSDIEKFTRLSFKAQSKTIAGELLNITSTVATQNKAIFRINQAAGIANAIINTYEGVSETLSAYPWPLSGVMAAAHLAAGLAQVDAIRSAKFGGGGGGGRGAGSLGGGGAAVPTFNASPITGLPESPRDPGGAVVKVVIEGDVYGWDDFIQEKVVEGIKDAVDNRDVVLISRDSRNARELIS